MEIEKIMRSRGVLIPAFAAVFLLAGLPSAEESPPAEIRAFVSILPQAYFVERVGGSHVEVEVLVAPGQSPATFEPTPKQMAALSRADVYFRIGLPFEDRLLKKLTAASDRLKVVDTRRGIELRPMEEAHGHTHAGKGDPHVWLDPKLARIQAKNIADGLTRLDPAHEPIFRENLLAFQADLNRVDSIIAMILAPLKGMEFYVFHPSYGYFGDAYGLTQVAVQAGGKEPGAKQLAELIDKAKREEKRVIFVQPQFSQSSAKTIAGAIGGTVVPLDPLARDYLENLERMAREITRALGWTKEE